MLPVLPGRPVRARAVAVALAVASALAACSTGQRVAIQDGDQPPHEPVTSTAYDPSRDASTYGHPRSTESFDPTRPWRAMFEEQVTLDDGRRVRFWYSEDGSRLKEQHYSPVERSWTRPRVVHRSPEPDPCQGITLVTRGDLVAVAADFALYCYDGEPPDDAVAAVSYGDLTDWRVHSYDVDSRGGWTRVRIRGDRVRWRDLSWHGALEWTPDEGFRT